MGHYIFLKSLLVSKGVIKASGECVVGSHKT